MSRQRLEIKGMTCEHCALNVEAVLKDAGAKGVFVDYRRRFAEFDPQGVDLDKAREFIKAAGYDSGELAPIEGDGQPKQVEAARREPGVVDAARCLCDAVHLGEQAGPNEHRVEERSAGGFQKRAWPPAVGGFLAQQPHRQSEPEPLRGRLPRPGRPGSVPHRVHLRRGLSDRAGG